VRDGRRIGGEAGGAIPKQRKKQRHIFVSVATEPKKGSVCRRDVLEEKEALSCFGELEVGERDRAAATSDRAKSNERGGRDITDPDDG